MMTPKRQGPGRKITNDKIREIQRLLDQHIPQKEIQKIANVSRMTIYKINKGLKQPQAEETESEHSAFFSGPVERCPACGRKVHMPCLACQIEHRCSTEKFNNDRRQKMEWKT